MTIHRRAARRDSNEVEIVRALIAAGASVTHLSGVDGLPDLLVGYQGRTVLLEVKHLSPTGKTVRQTGRSIASQPAGGWANSAQAS